MLLALIGGQFSGVPEGEICGAVISIRYTEDILGVWNKNSQDRDMTEKIRDAIKRVLQLPSHAYMVCLWFAILLARRARFYVKLSNLARFRLVALCRSTSRIKRLSRTSLRSGTRKPGSRSHWRVMVDRILVANLADRCLGLKGKRQRAIGIQIGHGVEKMLAVRATTHIGKATANYA